MKRKIVIEIETDETGAFCGECTNKDKFTDICALFGLLKHIRGKDNRIYFERSELCILQEKCNDNISEKVIYELAVMCHKELYPEGGTDIPSPDDIIEAVFRKVNEGSR